MTRWLLVASLLIAAGACETRREVAAPDRARTLKLQAGLYDPALSSALATAAPTDNLEVIVNYDETATTRDAVTSAVLGTGAGVVQFKHLDLLAALATPAQISAIAGVPGVQGVYLNRQLTYYGHAGSGLWLLHESVPAIRADAVQAMGITGKGVGIAILDSGIDGLYNPDVHYPDKTVQNVKVIFNLKDIVTFSGPAPKPLKQGVDIFAESLPNSETSVGHGTHVSGIAAGLGAASAGYYTGVAPGAKLIGIGTGGIPGDRMYHPDITAPGVHIVSTRASTGTVLNGLDANHDFNVTSTCAISLTNEPYYTCASGTSMATPHVVGVVALMQEAAGGKLTPDRVASVITQTARPLPGFAVWEVGAGYVDALAAVNAVRQ